jgi:rubrerythrin
MMNPTNESKVASRRNFALGAGLASLAAAAVRSNAQSTTTPSPSTDLAVLNYALTLEHLEAAFYTQGLAQLKASDFANASFAKVLGSGTVNGVFANLGRIRDHEVAHVNTLTGVVRSLGGTPVEACSYNFSFDTAEEFIRTAYTLEETGVQAYDGAIAMITSGALKSAGASIATVEARHAAYLSLLSSAIPFPKAFDDTKTMREILTAVTPLINSCGSTPFGVVTTAILMPKNLTTVNSQITLDASQSMSATGQPLKYELRSVVGSVSISQANTAKPLVQFRGGVGDYIFDLIVTDSNGATSTDRIVVRYVGR